jgi:hypothetical protein
MSRVMIRMISRGLKRYRMRQLREQRELKMNSERLRTRR